MPTPSQLNCLTTTNTL